MTSAMYYEDEARRFNFLSGFVLGAIIGSGLALLARPAPVRTAKRQVARVAKKARRQAETGIGSLTRASADKPTRSRQRKRRAAQASSR